MKNFLAMIGRAFVVAGVFVSVSFSVNSALAESWKFGVMSDTQWTVPDDGRNPNTVAVGIIDQLNQQFIDKEVKFVIQVGDPNSKDLAKKDVWGRRGNGTPLGVAEISKKLKHKKGAVGMAHAGDPAKADSQFYITRQAGKIPEGKYAIFGQVTSGMDVVDKIEVGDTVKRMYIK